MLSGGRSSGLGGTVQSIDRFPPWDVSEHPFVCLKRGIILQDCFTSLVLLVHPSPGIPAEHHDPKLLQGRQVSRRSSSAWATSG